MKKKILSPDYVKLLFTYDNGKLIWNQRPLEHFKCIRNCNMWNTQNAGKEAGRIRKSGKGYRCDIGIDNISYSRYIIVWAIHKNEWRPGEIDHKDVDSLNDKIENLRIANKFQNIMNRKVSKNNKLGIKGVRKKCGKFESAIKIHGKTIYLGRFLNLEDAKFAYLEAANKYAGEFARG